MQNEASRHCMEFNEISATSISLRIPLNYSKFLVFFTPISLIIIFIFAEAALHGVCLPLTKTALNVRSRFVCLDFCTRPVHIEILCLALLLKFLFQKHNDLVISQLLFTFVKHTLHTPVFSVVAQFFASCSHMKKKKGVEQLYFRLGFIFDSQHFSCYGAQYSTEKYASQLKYYEHKK